MDPADVRLAGCAVLHRAIATNLTRYLNVPLTQSPEMSAKHSKMRPPRSAKSTPLYLLSIGSAGSSRQPTSWPSIGLRAGFDHAWVRAVAEDIVPDAAEGLPSAATRIDRNRDAVNGVGVGAREVDRSARQLVGLEEIAPRQRAEFSPGGDRCAGTTRRSCARSAICLISRMRWGT
jgi:hypothetical protein